MNRFDSRRIRYILKKFDSKFFKLDNLIYHSAKTKCEAVESLFNEMDNEWYGYKSEKKLSMINEHNIYIYFAINDEWLKNYNLNLVDINKIKLKSMNKVKRINLKQYGKLI
jgi:hypothetical protein